VRDQRRSCSLRKFCVLLLIFSWVGGLWAQSDTSDLNALDEDVIVPALKSEILSPAVAEFQIRQYLINQVPPPPKAPATAQEWTAESARLRHHLLDDVVFHGWPKEWVDAQPKFEDLGVIETGAGYRIRKLRYEIVPGFQSTALLYEPDHLSGKMPAILNLHGHVGPLGEAIEFKQKRCINYARHGILALNLEWFSYGELKGKENEHWIGAQLDLVGANVLGIFHLEMRRGLDYLYEHPNVDRNRIGVTGLSGGGWQTILLSSLDERVKASNPVAGFSSLRSRVEAKEYGDMGDTEQSAPDLVKDSDYPYLVAMMAPRPTLLTYNAEDSCCFRASLVKPTVYDGIKPFFKLYGKEDVFQWHENRDPGTHNYQLDNRLADYRFFSQQFGLPLIDNEEGSAAELRSYDELKISLPKDNLTMLGLAKKLAAEIVRPPIPSEASAKAGWAESQRTKLKEIVRYKPVDAKQVWEVAMTKHQDVQSISYLFEMSNGLSANGVWFRSIAQSSETAPVTIVLNDDGREAGVGGISDRITRGEQVLAADLMFNGSSWKPVYPYLFAQMLDAVGDRPIGMEAAQLITLARWACARAGVSKVRLEAAGIRNQGIALVAAALEPELFSDISIQKGMRSLSYLLDLPVEYHHAPELFCLDLYKNFDIDSLEAMAAPARIKATNYVELPHN
jgi:dienelactone hydrolase